ncbi:MAG: vWA domain-containing protein [Candidatus Asgardarchaeum sp.]
MIRPDIPKFIPTAEAELLIFLLDSSTSMASTKTFDGRTKSTHLYLLVQHLLKRLLKSPKRNTFRFCFIYFSDIIKVLKSYTSEYYPVNIALKILKEPFDIIPGGATAIGYALREAMKVLDHFMKDEGIPDVKSSTIFLFTDGRENLISHDNLIAIANQLKSHIIAPSLATISLGKDADKNTLIEIASNPNDRQLRHLDMANLIDFLERKDKLFLEGHEGDKFTRKRVEILRNFVETLSTTRK